MVVGSSSGEVEMIKDATTSQRYALNARGWVTLAPAPAAVNCSVYFPRGESQLESSCNQLQ